MAKVQLGDWGTYYANSGTSTPDSGNNGDFQTRWSIKYEQDLEKGITTIYVQPYRKIYLNSSGYAYLVGTTVTTTINGTSKTQSFGGGGSVETITTYTGTANGYTYVYGTTQTFTITHESDGTAQCKFSGSMKNTVFGLTRTASHTWDLPTINMASTISNSTSSTSRIDFDSNATFTITRPNDTITHTLTYDINGTTHKIPSDGSAVGTSISYAFPISLINNYPSNTEVAITVTCTSSNGTTSSTIVYLKVPDSYVPTIGLTLSDVGSVPSSWGIYVKGKSKIKGVISASGSGGSTIKSYSANANNQTFNTSEFTTSELNNSGTLTVKASVTDSRGRSVSTNKSITVYDYSTPTYVKIEVVRCDASGNEDNDGTYGKVVCQYSISSCNSKNSKSLQVSYGSTTKTFTLSSYSGTITASTSNLFSGLDVTANHTFTFKLIDSFSEIPQSYVMPPSYVLESKLAGGKGITFGQIATKDGFNVHMNAQFHKELIVNGIECKNLYNKDVPSANGYISGNIYLDSSVAKSIILECDSNETYTISKIASTRFVVGSYANKPVANGIATNYKINNSGTSITITTGENDKYLVVYYYISSNDTLTESEIRESIQIEKGDKATTYTPYKKFGYNEEVTLFEGNIFGGDEINVDFTPYKRLMITYVLYDYSSENTAGSSNIVLLDLIKSGLQVKDYVVCGLAPYNMYTPTNNVANTMGYAFKVNAAKNSFSAKFIYNGEFQTSKTVANGYYVSKIVGIK